MWSNANNFLRRWFCLDIFDLLLIYLFMDFCFSFLFVWLKDDLIFHFFRTSPINVQRQSNHKNSSEIDLTEHIILTFLLRLSIKLYSKTSWPREEKEILIHWKRLRVYVIQLFTHRWQYRIDMKNVNCNEKSPVWIFFLHETV